MDATVNSAIEQRLRKDRDHLCEEATAADSEDARTKRGIEAIEAALTRLADGGYGTCLGCGRRIPIERLRLLPATGYCVRCARRGRQAPPGQRWTRRLSIRGRYPPTSGG